MASRRRPSRLHGGEASLYLAAARRERHRRQQRGDNRADAGQIDSIEDQRATAPRACAHSRAVARPPRTRHPKVQRFRATSPQPCSTWTDSRWAASSWAARASASSDFSTSGTWCGSNLPPPRPTRRRSAVSEVAGGRCAANEQPTRRRRLDPALVAAAFGAIRTRNEERMHKHEAYIGETPFRDGLRRYFAKHAYSNATSADLWAALEAASNKPIAAIALGFSRQAGFP